MEMSEESDLLLWKLHLKLRMENFRDLRAPPRGVLVARTWCHWSSGQSSGMEGASGPSLGPRFASVERRDSVMASDATLRRMTSSDSIEDLLHRHSECIGSTLANISSLHKFTEIKSSPSRLFSRSPSWLLRRPTR